MRDVGQQLPSCGVGGLERSRATGQLAGHLVERSRERRHFIAALFRRPCVEVAARRAVRSPPAPPSAAAVPDRRSRARSAWSRRPARWRRPVRSSAPAAGRSWRTADHREHDDPANRHATDHDCGKFAASRPRQSIRPQAARECASEAIVRVPVPPQPCRAGRTGAGRSIA